MQNKKLLSTLLVLVMICACAFGMLVTNAGAEMTAEPIEWLGDFASTIESIEGANFDGTKYAEIEIPAGEEVTASAENGVLFGVETIFDANGARLPIVIKGEDDTATITFEGVSGDVSCSNSYTFQGLNFFIADAEEQINFYAGSGEVVLDTVVLSADDTGKNAYFYADNAAAAAFAGWTAPAEGELIATSLTFKNTNYTQADWNNGGATADGAACKGQVGVVGAAADFANAEVTEITAAMTSATLKIEDSKLSGVWLRKTTAASPVSEVNFIVNDSSDTGIANTSLGGIIGVGVSSINDGGANKAGPWELGNFDYNVTINGGTISGRVVFFRGAVFTGDMNVTINGGKFGSEVFVAYGDGVKTGAIFGKITATINDGNFAGSVFGSNAAASCFNEENTITEVDKIDNLTYINGGTLKTYQGNRVSGSIHTVVTGGTIANYHGSYSTASGGGVYDLVVNTIDGGTITNFYGSGFNKHWDYADKAKTIAKPGIAGYEITNLINNFNGGTITTAYGAGTPQFVENVTNNFNGTALTTVYGTYWADYTAADTKLDNPDGDAISYEGFGGTKVTGTLTNNVNVATWANGSSKVEAFRPIGYSIAGDFVLNLNCTQKKFAGFAPNAIPTAEITVKNFTLNATDVAGWGGETFLNDLHATGDATFNFTNCTNNSHLVALYGGKVDGDLNVNVDTFNFSSTTKHRFFLIYDPLDAAITSTKDAIGGDINLVMKKLTNVSSKANKEAQRLVIAGRRASGAIASYPVIENDVNLTFEDTTLLSWAGNSSEINGTFAVTYKGTNKFANDAFPSNAARVNKQVNNIAGTITTDFYGAGAPVGTWVEVPATEEGAEPTLEFVPGEIENNILPGAAIKAKFFGSGSETVKSVTNTMTGGSISSASGNSSTMLVSVGCFYGNYGPVTDKVVNNFYSGSIGNNVYGTHGDLACPVYVNIGNNLYAELNPEAEELTIPSFGRMCFVGGRTYTTETVTSVDPETQEEVTTTVKNYAFDAKTGSTGPVYVNVDGAKFAMVDMLYGPVVAPDANGDVANVTIKNATASTHCYFNINDTEVLPGNVNLTYDNFKLTAESRHYYGPSNVGGDLTFNATDFSVGGTAFLSIGDVGGDLTFTLKRVSAAYDLITTFRASEIHEAGSGSTSEYKANADSFLEIGGDFNMYAEDVTFGNNPSMSYRDVEGSQSTSSIKGAITGKYVRCTFLNASIHFTNRTPSGGHAFNEFDSCTFGGLKSATTIRMAMQSAGSAKKVFIYGDTVVGANTDLELGRQNNQSIYLGAKPDADYNPVAAETSLSIDETSGVWGVCREAVSKTDPSFKHRKNTSKTFIYDVTLEGSGIFAPLPDADAEAEGYQIAEDVVAALILVGNIELGETSPTIYINGADSTGTVSAKNGNWIEGKTYITTVNGADINKISARSYGDITGYGKKVENAIVGAELDFSGDFGVSMTVSDRIGLNLWIPKADVQAYLESGMVNSEGKSAYEYSVLYLTEEEILYKGFITAEDLAALGDEEYFKVSLGAVSANNFNTAIVLSGSSFWSAYTDGGNDLTILAIAQMGMEGEYTADEINLFKAIYNYGASVLGEAMYTMDGFVQTGAAAPVYQKGSADDIAFTSMSLLMGDAIGIRFKGNVVDAETVVTMTVNGEESTCFNYDAEKGTVDVYVNMENVNDEITFIIYTDAAPAIAVKTSIKGYTEAVMTKGNAELAVAQLAQACANMLA